MVGMSKPSLQIRFISHVANGPWGKKITNTVGEQNNYGLTVCGFSSHLLTNKKRKM